MRGARADLDTISSVGDIDENMNAHFDVVRVDDFVVSLTIELFDNGMEKLFSQSLPALATSNLIFNDFLFKNLEPFPEERIFVVL